MDILRFAVAWLTLIGAVTCEVIAWTSERAKEQEPPFVLHLSTWALILTGITNVLAASSGGS